MAATAAAAAAAAAVSVVSGTTRWCPTPDQLMILEEMYRGGLRTPNASQIQQITAHLAHYGRIEGKNVFYWFQNHKARDRQKLRRRLCMSHHLLSCAHYYAAANAGHHHHLLGAAAVAPMRPNQQQYYAGSCAGGGFDQHLIPAAVAAPTTEAYAAAGYGYPAFGAAATQTASRFAAGVNPSPPNPLSTSFNYQGGVGSGGGSPEYSLGRLGSFGVVVVEEDTCRSSRYEQQPPMQTEEAAPGTGMLCRPLKTLDLFPGASSREKGLGC